MLFKSFLPTITLATAVAAGPHDAPRRRHAGVSSLHIELDPAQNGTLLKRGQTFQNARFSMYSPETGNQVACGGFYHNSDWIVALNSPQFGSIAGHMCGQQITISLNGKTAQATIVDECPGCPQNGLDCTPAIANFFGFFDDLAWGSWSVGGNPVSMPPPPTAFKALFTTSTPPPPTTSSIVPTVSSTWSLVDLEQLFVFERLVVLVFLVLERR